MTVLYVLFAVLMGGCCLLVFTLAAALLVESLYRVYPWLAQFDVDLNTPLRLPAWARRTDWQVVEPPLMICLARNPLAATEYLVGAAGGQVVWTTTKQHARILDMSDRLALRAWQTWVCDRTPDEIFICLVTR